ncbi:hypothetical protein LSH36_48g07037 [Paralvinella palmiformis]|uniref:Platelet-derived growth factor (PDGF) family profile domain-containing protein n=1 Tax=Paralvinella palmiformis TaxID=53620 RepID=A0AAD9K6J5_9ANNE|nr:hypothetical protein LSH36_48g07037 [Paralvinella palmiformis]
MFCCCFVSIQLAIRPVPVDVYREAMTDARTHYDVFRIFLPLQMTDAEIDTMLWSQDAVSDLLTIISRGSGGAMPHFTPGIHPALPPVPAATALVSAPTALIPTRERLIGDFNDADVMMSDGPVCRLCHRIEGGAAVVAGGSSSSLATSHGQLQAESWHHRPRRRRHKPDGAGQRSTRRCKRRRKALAANIRKCRANQNQRRCRTLRNRYKRLRQACKRDSENRSIIPGGAAGLPDPHRPPNRRLPPDPEADASDKAASDNEMTNLYLFLLRCGKPVPQVVRVREILARGDEEYFPSCVLRYRCRRDAGCCQHEFQVAKVHSQDHRVHYQNLTMKTFTVENDTECGCVQIVTPVEKPCPHPFVFDMDSQSCRCRDASFKRSCKRILRGEKELLPSDIRCIREDKCRALNICSYGNFDMTSYQCPKKPDTFISSGDAKRVEKGRHRG